MNRWRETDKIFRTLFSEILCPCGFVFKKKAFYRIPANNLLLIISTVKRYPYYEVTFDAIPFAHGYTGGPEWRGIGIDWFMANRARRIGTTYERSTQDSYEMSLKRMQSALSSVILPEMNKICSLETLLAYESWFSNSVGLWPESVFDAGLYLQYGDYPGAYNCIQKCLKRAEERSICSASAKGAIEPISGHELWKNIADKIETARYSEVDAITQKRCETTRKTCEHLGIL